MRIWSIHPKYLDSKGLVALWRETLLAKNVLEGKTQGYKNHPQLIRFKNTDKPLDCINQYLSVVYYEAENRNYRFNRDKINWNFSATILKVSNEQIIYETSHLINKLKTRDKEKYLTLKNIEALEPHPIFEIIKGQVESWEKIK